jgi:quercetin dioxygenase-like cupin family protein
MTIVRAADVKMLETPGKNHTGGIATPKQNAEDVLVLRQQQEPGGSNPMHRHDREEVMIQLDGIVSVTVGDEEVQLSAGDALIVPAHTLHQIANRRDAGAEWLLVAPAHLRFYGADSEEITPKFLS